MFENNLGVQKHFQLLAVCNDSVVNNHERVLRVRAVRMTVDLNNVRSHENENFSHKGLTSFGGPCVAQRVWAMPECVDKTFVKSRALHQSHEHETNLLGNSLLQGCNFPTLLDQSNRCCVVHSSVSIDGNASRVVPTVFQSFQAIDKQLNNVLALTRNAVVQIRKDPTHDENESEKGQVLKGERRGRERKR